MSNHPRRFVPHQLLSPEFGFGHAEVNISSYPGTRVPGLFFHSRAVILKSGCFVQKYWSGTVTRNTVMQRAADYKDLIKPNLAALDYTDAVRTWCS